MELWTIGAFARAARLSPKALRLYDELHLLVPAHTDPVSGYRRYSQDQLVRARLVARLRRVGMPLARIREVCDLPRGEAAKAVAAYWDEVEAEQRQRRDVVRFLVDTLSEGTTMLPVAVREMPARTMICSLRHVTGAEVNEFTTGMVLRLGDGTVPSLSGMEGAPFFIYHGEVDQDSDGPIEWCRPIPDEAAEAMAARFPDLTIRQDPAHREAYVRLTRSELTPADGMRAGETLEAWMNGQPEPSVPLGPFRQVFFGDPRGAAPDTPLSDVVAPLPLLPATAAG
ncbi:MerR family transcriptional regulator [Streptacidiphilus carbonis]|uniref:MerR family transcriptional regulator n=1 Tax=Streptacidiphilus carbonis TaxID=105422 RepID=UPI0005AB4110|nr:MerR family transcriptional regulator [Streptacidiphilus carbonis]